ncbi:MAG TPA: hypothetical protein VJQ47_13575 [Steroidobacteraceae bacterium]|nr:hypothetical protein [Steroidobacteraceae bacterium]
MSADEIGFRPDGMRLPMRDLTATATLTTWGVVVALAIAWFFFSYAYFEDDGFIHLEFARSVANGQGFAFLGHVTNGDTAPFWVLILAAFHVVTADWILAGKAACIAGLAFTLAGAWRLTSDLPRETAAHRWLPAAVILLTATNPFVVHWMFSGMEAVTALGLTLWAIWAVFVVEPTRPRLLFASILLAIGPLLRPELMLFDALVAPALLRGWNTHLRARPVKHRFATLSAVVLFLALPLAIWCAYALNAFGSVVPNTNMAKRGSGAIPELAMRLASVYLSGFPITLLLLPIGLWQAFARRRTPLSVWLLLVWPLACVAFYLLNHTLVQTRYCVLSMPSLTIAVFWLLGDLARPRAVIAAAGVSLAAAVAVNALAGIPQVANKKLLRHTLSSISAYIRAQVPANAPVAVFAIGQVGFETQHPLIDTGGITQPSVFPYLRDPAAVLQWAQSSGAQYIIGDDLPHPGATIVFRSELPYVGWSFQRSLYQTTGNYNVYKLHSR